MKKKTTIKTPAGPELEETYETEIEFVCPVRGLVKQKVKVKKYKSTEFQPVVDVRQSKSLADQLDVKYSGLMLDDELADEEENT